MEESFTPWLLRKSERDFFTSCVEYSKEVLDHMKMLRDEIDLYLNENWTRTERLHEMTTKKGHEIIRNRRTLIIKLSEKHIDSDHRISLSNIVFNLSAVSSHIDSTSHRMAFMRLKIKPSVKARIRVMGGKTEEIIALLNDAIRFLNTDLEKVIEKTVEISKVEDEVDAIRRDLLKKVIQEGDIGGHTEFYVLTEMLRSLESISDSVEFVSNDIENIAISHLP